MGLWAQLTKWNDLISEKEKGKEKVKLNCTHKRMVEIDAHEPRVENGNIYRYLTKY